LRDIVRDYVVETLAGDDAVLVIDETGFLKQGKASCDIGRQFTGSAGKITNCQIGVFAAYVSRHGHAFIDRTLYLPKAWTVDPARMAAAHVPDGTSFATKPAIAARIIEGAITAGVPFALVRVEGHREAIEDSFEAAKNELGHDHNETRSWHGWHRHVSLVMLAFAMMAAIRHQANVTSPPKTNHRATQPKIPSLYHR
jgi:SRSO17 transposase